MEDLSLSEKLALSWIAFLQAEDIEITNQISGLYKHRFFELQKDLLLKDDFTTVDHAKLDALANEIKRRFKDVS